MQFKKAYLHFNPLNAGLFQTLNAALIHMHHNPVFQLMQKSPKFFNQSIGALRRQSNNY